MKISSLFLHNIRKYENKSFRFSHDGISQKVLIAGPNGAGKTTVLESIIFPFRGFLYGSSHQRFIRKGEKSGEIFLSFFTEDPVKHEISSRHDLQAKIDLTGKTTVYLDGKESSRESIRRFGDVFWFFPQDMLVVLGGEDERRNFLDTVLKISDPGFRKVLREYSYALKSRNAVLKKMETVEGVYRNSELDAVEEVLSELGKSIVEKRMRLVDELNRLVEEIFGRAGGRQGVRLKYATSFKCGSDIRESILESLYVSRGTDYMNDSTSVGPHRDRLLIHMKNREARYEASYGERKLVALALKVAGYIYIRQKRSENIIFLADDIFSELDSQHRETILRILVESCSGFFATATEVKSELADHFGIDVLRIGG